MSRHVGQIRPKNNPDGFPYSPQRDLANIYLPMMREVMLGLDKEHWSDARKTAFERDGVTEEMLGKAAMLFAHAHSLFIREPGITSPEDAFIQAGFMELPEVVRTAMFSRLGEVVTGGFFVGLRDITIQGLNSPVQTEMADMLAAARGFAHRMSGHKVTDLMAAAMEKDFLSAERQQIAATLKQSQALVETQILKIAGLEAEVLPLRWLSADIRKHIVDLNRHSGCARLVATIKLAWRVYKS